MKIIISPDSFKGSLTAIEAAQQIAAAVREVDSTIETELLPIADGGEGTLDILIGSTAGQLVGVTVEDPLGRTIQASYGILGDGETAVIEMAQASGLTLLKEEERNPLVASSYGTGQLILHALDAGFRKFIIGLGGSATNDGGAGMLQALGMRFLDDEGCELKKGGGFLHSLNEIDCSMFDRRISDTQVIIACDVDNPLTGPNGATKVFGPQKGVMEDMEDFLDANLLKLANKIKQQTKKDIHNLAGSGAAGGVGGALLAFFPAVMRPGIEVLMDLTHFRERIAGGSFLITGEGKSDDQTLHGKGPMGIAKTAKDIGIPVILLSGMVDESSKSQLDAYFDGVYSVCNDVISQQDSIERPAYYLKERATEILTKVLRK